MIGNLLNRLLILAISILVLLLNCHESIVEPQQDGNLLPNGSFELNNQPTLQGWHLGNERAAELVNQAAPNGGNWALQLTSDGAPTTAFIYTPVPNIKSGDIVRLSAYVRASGNFPGTGIIRLTVGKSINSGSIKETSSSDTVWTRISIMDTVKMGMNDTLWVILSSPVTEIAPFQQLFDLVKLEKVAK